MSVVLHLANGMDEVYEMDDELQVVQDAPIEEETDADS